MNAATAAAAAAGVLAPALRPFTRNDWMGYCGATAAPDGRAPVMAELDGDDLAPGWPAGVTGVTIIADDSGVSLQLHGAGDGAYDSWDDVFLGYLNAHEGGVYDRAVVTARGLAYPLSVSELTAVGFEIMNSGPTVEAAWLAAGGSAGTY